MSFDYYKEANELISILLDSQIKELQKYGKKLDDAIAQGATGTEIFMALRWNINKLLAEPFLAENVRIKTLKLKDELDKALR